MDHAYADVNGIRLHYVTVGRGPFAIAHPERLEKLVIVNAPHPAIFERELRENPAQQSASRYMLTFRSPEAEAILAANNCARLVESLSRDLGEHFTAADRAM